MEFQELGSSVLEIDLNTRDDMVGKDGGRARHGVCLRSP